MKSFLLFCLILFAYMLCPKNASAQYKSVFGDSTTSWSVIEGAWCNYINTTSYDVWKKSVRNGKTYYEILGFQTDIGIIGPVIREDTVAGKIYASHFEDTTEHLLIDFSLQAGDTFLLERRESPDLKYIAEEVYYVNGLKHIKLNPQHNLCGPIGEQLTFIEGTGTSAGLHNWTFNNDSLNSYLLCHYKDGEKIYSNKYYQGECYRYEGSWFPKYNLAEARVFPNPTTGDGFVQLYNPDGRILKLSIFDLYGRLVFETKSETPYFPFSISLQADGIYPYILQDDLGNIVRGKIVKD